MPSISQLDISQRLTPELILLLLLSLLLQALSTRLQVD
jgi:hypothetical protein